MSELDLLSSYKNKYIQLYNDINRIITNLKSAIDMLDSAYNNFENCYVVDDYPYNSDAIKKIKQELVNEKNDLQNKVLYSINLKISDYNKRISNL